MESEIRGLVVVMWVEDRYAAVASLLVRSYLPLEGRDDLGDGLGGSGGGGDDVAGGGTSSAPVLLGGGVDDGLGGGHGVDGGHEGLVNAEGVVDALEARSEAVSGRARACERLLVI